MLMGLWQRESRKVSQVRKHSSRVSTHTSARFDAFVSKMIHFQETGFRDLQ
jgi:hypothetical protein